MPQPTDLVTDLPADFEVFGQAVDTSLADLKGGTSGQVLSKNSNTDMDFVWVTSDDANAIQNTIVDAKGDLIGATAADTPARLAVGTNGQVLTADSTAATGLAWATPSTGGMTLLSTTTLSGATTNITGISGSYINLFVSVIGLGITSAGQITVKPNGSGFVGFQSTSKSNSGTADLVAGGITRIFSTDTTSSGFTLNNSNFTIFDYASSNRHPFSGASIGIVGGGYVSYVFGGGIELASAITSIEFGTTAGTFNAGTVKIYGVK
jgi:hypothetical protein